MGYNTVAVLLNDNLDIGARDPEIGGRIQAASRAWATRDRAPINLSISARTEKISASYGSIISQDHADGYQVVIVHGNTGWRVDDSRAQSYTELNWSAIDQMTRALERHGFKVTKLRKPKAERA